MDKNHQKIKGTMMDLESAVADVGISGFLNAGQPLSCNLKAGGISDFIVQEIGLGDYSDDSGCVAKIPPDVVEVQPSTLWATKHVESSVRNVGASETASSACRDFAKGRCLRGENCRFEHIAQSHSGESKSKRARSSAPVVASDSLPPPPPIVDEVSKAAPCVSLQATLDAVVPNASERTALVKAHNGWWRHGRDAPDWPQGVLVHAPSSLRHCALDNGLGHDAADGIKLQLRVAFHSTVQRALPFTSTAVNKKTLTAPPATDDTAKACGDGGATSTSEAGTSGTKLALGEAFLCKRSASLDPLFLLSPTTGATEAAVKGETGTATGAATTSLRPFLLPAQDMEALQRLLNTRGESDESAAPGEAVVGKSLSREDRTKVHQALANASKGLRSKTVQAPEVVPAAPAEAAEALSEAETATAAAAASTAMCSAILVTWAKRKNSGKGGKGGKGRKGGKGAGGRGGGGRGRGGFARREEATDSSNGGCGEVESGNDNTENTKKRRLSHDGCQNDDGGGGDNAAQGESHASGSSSKRSVSWLSLVMCKQGVEHSAAIQAVAKALKVKPSDIGVSGIKDKVATTFQWVSVRDCGSGVDDEEEKETPLRREADGCVGGGGGNGEEGGGGLLRRLQRALLDTGEDGSLPSSLPSPTLPHRPPPAPPLAAASKATATRRTKALVLSVGGGRVLLAYPQGPLKAPLEVGQAHKGNRFTLTLRNLRRTEPRHRSSGSSSSSSSSSSGSSSGDRANDENNSPAVSLADAFGLAVSSVGTFGFVNFFGLQRTGEPPLTPTFIATTSQPSSSTPLPPLSPLPPPPFLPLPHPAAPWMVGRAMVRGDFARAVDLVLGGCCSGGDGRRGEKRSDSNSNTSGSSSGGSVRNGGGGDGGSDDTRDARRVWRDTKDPKATLKALNSSQGVHCGGGGGGVNGGGGLLKERSLLLHALLRFGSRSHAAALRSLPRTTRTMWVHAFQAVLFNHVAAKRVAMTNADSSPAPGGGGVVAGLMPTSASSAPSVAPSATASWSASSSSGSVCLAPIKGDLILTLSFASPTSSASSTSNAPTKRPTTAAAATTADSSNQMDEVEREEAHPVAGGDEISGGDGAGGTTADGGDGAGGGVVVWDGVSPLPLPAMPSSRSPAAVTGSVPMTATVTTTTVTTPVTELRMPTMRDVVLPLVGTESVYPAHASGQHFAALLREHGVGDALLVGLRLGVKEGEEGGGGGGDKSQICQQRQGEREEEETEIEEGGGGLLTATASAAAAAAAATAVKAVAATHPQHREDRPPKGAYRRLLCLPKNLAWRPLNARHKGGSCGDGGVGGSSGSSIGSGRESEWQSVTVHKNSDDFFASSPEGAGGGRGGSGENGGQDANAEKVELEGGGSGGEQETAKGVQLRFDLDSGAFATVLVRELTKHNAPLFAHLPPGL